MDKLKDSDLREAIQRKYANTPSMPADFEKSIMNRIMKDRDEQINSKSNKC